MASERETNPEWSAEDFARARPADEILPSEFMSAFRKGRGRPKGTTKADAKLQITLRLDSAVVEKFRATGPGWQSRINEILRKAS